MDPQETFAGPRHLRPGIRRRASARYGRAGWTVWPPDARSLAIILGVLAMLGLLGAALSFVVDLFVAPWRLLGADAEESLHLVASVVGLAGAFRLERAAPHARMVVLAGLALNVVATLAFSAATLTRPETVVPMLTWLALAVLTVMARRRPAPPGA